MGRTAVFGGTFDPPHAGHAYVIRTVMKEICPDRLLVIPAGISPGKQLKDEAASPQHRMQMCSLTFSDIPGVEVSDMEIRREGISFTADTLRELHAQDPEEKLYLVIGSDKLLGLCGWKDLGDILKLCALAVVRRNGEDGARTERILEELERERGAEIRRIGNGTYPASSTGARADAERDDGLNEKVRKYIKEKGLYGTDR